MTQFLFLFIIIVSRLMIECAGILIGNISNGGFTGNISPWGSTGVTEYIADTTGICRSGSCVKVGASVAAIFDSSVFQEFTPIAQQTGLSFWYKMVGSAYAPYEYTSFTLVDYTAVTTITMPRSDSKNWVNIVTSIIPGHSYKLTLINHKDDYSSAYTYFDDVTLSTCPNTVCTLCPAGASVAICSCLAGTYAISSGCTPCPRGTYTITGSSSCTSCPGGTYNADFGSSSCTPCPVGTYNANIGSTSSSSCTSCPAGTYAITGSSSCTS